MRRQPVHMIVAALVAALVVAVPLVGAAPGAAVSSMQSGVEVRVPNYAFDPLNGGEPKLSGPQHFDGPEAGFRLVQLEGPTKDIWLAGLRGAGLEVLQYYPHHTYLVWGPESGLRAAESLSYVRWAGNFHPAYKINSNLVGRAGVVKNVDVFFYNDGKVGTTQAALTALGAKIIQVYPAQPDRTFFVALAELDASAFEAVSRLGTVLWLGYSHPEPILDDEMSDQIQAGNHPGGIPVTGYNAHLTTLGVTGAGVRWATIDTGVDYDHPDLGPSIVAGYSFPGACNFPGQPGSDCSGGGHGTHVTGIIGGDATGAFTDANGFLYGLGVAPGYDIVAMNSLSAAAWPPAGGWQEHSKQAVLMSAIGANNSWTTGEGTNQGYQASERTHDITVQDGNFDTAAVEPFIQVFSAGNSGPAASTLTAPKEAKNLIVVASSDNYRAGNINNISSFSSRGPAVDGRIVPTITAPGQQIASSRNDLGGSCSTAIAGTSNLYAFCSGTSMAAPHVSGAVALATQWWRGFNAGANPSPAMAKALLVNSAVDMGTPDIPNPNEGWGRVNITRMLQPEVNVEYWDQTHVFGNSGESWSISLGVQDPSQPLKVTLAWTDAPGAVGANPALVNNLNLTVINGSNTYRGNVFSAGWSATGGTADAINNLENVYIQTPAGSATIIIDAVNIAGDGVLGNADPTDQNFALICQNCTLAPDYTMFVSPSIRSICTPADGIFTVDVGSILGYSDPVTLSAAGNPAGTTASFSTNPVTPGGSSTLTIGNTGAATAGSYPITVTGTSTTGSKDVNVELVVFNTAPGAPTLTTPANGAANVSTTPTFTWSGVAGAATYSIEVATDAAFTNIVASANGLVSPTWTSNVTLNSSTVHHWRVRVDNSCGVGAYSATWSFTTVAAPGDCGPGTTPNILYSYGFESGAAGWTTPAGVGANTWAVVTTNPYAGANHYRGTNPAAVSDQRLVSAPVALPVGQNPLVLKFWHVPNLENNGTTACYDGGILEVSTDGGTAWTQVPDSALLVGGYTGTISSSFSNPLGGLQAWCSASTTTYRQTIADVSPYAGQTVQFRWRIGTDTSISRPGWDVDDVMLQSCQVTSAAAISLNKTVGTTAGVCAATSAITVAAGTTVYYCYTVTNTGNVTLNLHDLVDDQLGSIFSGLNYALAPGASVDTVAAGLSIPAVINATTTNAATWTAYNVGPADVATSSAVAIVNVIYPNIVVDPLSLASTQQPGTTVTQALAIENTGPAPLVWEILEENLTRITPAPPVPDASADPSKARDAFDPAEPTGPFGPPAPRQAWNWPAVVLYDNGPLVTHPGDGFGGADASALQTGLGLGAFGFGHALTSGFRVADDLVVPAGGWYIDTMTFFAYQTGSPTTSTIDHVNLRIWVGVPGAPGSTIVFGDTTTNRFVSSTWTNMYRVTDTGLTGDTRPIMANVVTANVFLPAGTYWLDWQTGGTMASGPWAPPVSILGQTAKPGANALQYDPTAATWNPLTDTGTAMVVQDLPFLLDGSTTVDCRLPSDIPWLATSPITGTTAPAATTLVDVTFDSTGMAAGTYTGNLCILSNDPDAGPGNGTELVVVPVALTVEIPLVPAISLTKTVGTDFGVCAATSAITVTAGTTVYYCYTVENTGNVTLNLHDLVDDQLGSLFTGFPYALTPGSSVDTVAAGLSIPAVMNATTTNTATWTAYNAGPVDTVAAQASATVTVLQPADVFGTKTVAGAFVPGGTITYTIVLSNTGAGAQGDNAGDELSDTLPASLTATGATASSGTVTRVGNLVTWNGSIPAGGSVTITITATVNAVAFGTTISNQGTVNYDATGGGTNGATRLTDDPAMAGAADPTSFLVADPTAIPGLQPVGLAALALLTALAAAFALRRIA